MHKMFKALAITSLLIFSEASAGTYEELQKQDLEKRIAELEYGQKTIKVINEPASPKVTNGANFFVAADILFLTAREDGIVYANEVLTGEDSLSSVDLKSLQVGKDWKAGFRFILDYCMPHDNWDIQLSWFVLHGSKGDAKTTQESVVVPLDFIISKLGMANMDHIYAETSSSWGADIDLVDLEMGKNFYISPNLSLRPFLSVRGLGVHQELDNSYENAAKTQNAQANLKCNYDAFGPRLGLNGEWKFTDDFSLFGNAAIAGVFGKVRVSEKDLTLHDEEESHLSHNDGFSSGKAVSDLAVGFRWNHKFKEDRYVIAINLAWEHHEFFNFNNFPVWEDVGAPYPIDVKSQGDLSLQGISLGLKFDF